MNRHTVEGNLDAIRRLGLDLQGVDKKLRFEVKATSENKVNALLEKHKLTNKRKVVIHPTSRWMFKSWNPAAFSLVVDLLTEKGFFIVIISGPEVDEVEYAKSIEIGGNSALLNLAGQLSINECAALVKSAECFVGLDSVAMHIAAAVNTPCVALFGPTRDRSWHPWIEKHKVVTENFECRPCGLKGCGDGMLSECIQSIKPEAVVGAVMALVK